MNALDPLSLSALAAVAVLLALLMLRQRSVRGRSRASERSVPRESLDTVAAWPPEGARVLSVQERKAYQLLHRALPGFLVLAQVPLTRFLRVPSRHSYQDWVQRVGNLSADLLVCDHRSRVVAVVDVRTADESDRARRRHERMARVLKAAGIRVYTWRDDHLPSLSTVRRTLSEDLAPVAAAASGAKPAATPQAPLIPVAEMEEVLAAGDAVFQDTGHEPVSSSFFDEIESERGQLSKA